MKVLVVAAHPDDEVFGCGGVIARHTRGNDQVAVMVLADGVTSRFYQPGVSRGQELLKCKKIIARRKNEFFRAARILGVKKESCIFLGLPDQRLDTLSLLEIIKHIEVKAEKIAPDLIYTHHWGDLNRDHRICAEAVLTAFRPTSRIFKACKIFSFEVPGNMDLLPPKAQNRFCPGHFVDISSVLEVKLAAAGAYQSELRAWPHPLSAESLVELARSRAKGKKSVYAEAFVRLR